MFAFMSRRMSAASEAMVLAVLLTLSTAALGTFAITEPGKGDGNGSATPGQQVLVGTADDGVDRPATGRNPLGGRADDRRSNVPVRISHEDFHRTELQDAPVQVEGSWSADGPFVAALIEPVDPTQVAVTDEEPAAEAPSASRPKGKPKTLEGTLSFVMAMTSPTTQDPDALHAARQAWVRPSWSSVVAPRPTWPALASA